MENKMNDNFDEKEELKKDAWGERNISVVSLGLPDFEAIMRIVIKYFRDVTHYAILDEADGSQSLNFYPSYLGPSDKKELPYPMKLDELTTFAWGWLRTAKRAKEYNIDGSSRKGWHIQTGGSNHDKIKIKPDWIYYHK
jgi:hypothetical protein